MFKIYYLLFIIYYLTKKITFTFFFYFLTFNLYLLLKILLFNKYLKRNKFLLV